MPVFKKYKKLFLGLLFLIGLLYYSCDTTVSPPAEEKPPGQQKDIPWSSLADSPWPMGNHDPQNSNRSKYEGPVFGELEYKFSDFNIQAGITLYSDSLILLTGQTGLYMMNLYTMDTLWNINLGFDPTCTPLVNKNGVIFTIKNTEPSTVIALNKEGTVIWTFQLDGYFSLSGISIDKQGSIYLLDNTRNLYSINDNGNLNFSFFDSRFNPATGGLGFSPNSKLIYIPGTDVSLLAFNVDERKIEWTFGETNTYNAPVISSNGDILILPKPEPGTKQNSLYLINSMGELKWKYDFNYFLGSFYCNPPVIDKNGNIFFAADTIFSLTYEADLRWKKPIGGMCDSPILCDVENNIYVGYGINSNNISIKSFSNNGTVNWIFSDSDIGLAQLGINPLLTSNGLLVFPTWRNKIIYFIK